MEHTYKISGMTCQGCKAKVQSTLNNIPQVDNVTIDLASGKTEIKMSEHVSIAKLQESLSAKGDYTITESHTQAAPPQEVSKGFLETYKPLLMIVAFIATVSLLSQYPFNSFSEMLWMRHFMAGFFLVFSFFKLLNVKGFADSYIMYDVVAERWKGWAYIYPFVELSLGLAYLINWNPTVTNWITVVVLGVSSIGVIKSNLNKRKIKCACLGDVFNLPMSQVTIIEDVSMVLMATLMLVL